MCGIAGFLATGAGRHGPELLAAMGNAMAHRGPDGPGESLSPDGRAGLAHRRLAILDLSEGGAQPMASDDRRFALSFNGEVFNYREIREELKGRGHVFRSDSDTEVLLASCREWGVDGAVSRFISMFAFALWDEREHTLSLVRRMPDVYDEPFADSSAIPTMLVSAFTREHVTVSLSGDGGDELFCGFPRYDWIRYAGVAEKQARGAACPRLPTAWANSDLQRLSRDACAYARRHHDIRRQIESDRLWLSGSREG